MPDYKHLLIAVDFSASTDAVLKRGIDLAKTSNARVSLIHVVEFAQVDLSNELVMPQELELDRELLALAEKKMESLAEKHKLQSSPRFVSQGSTKREILNTAAEEGVDLIVIGSHGRHGIQLLLGSTANAVLHGAPCDVLAVRIRN
jgi:universal stress protein A